MSMTQIVLFIMVKIQGSEKKTQKGYMLYVQIFDTVRPFCF